MRVAAAAYEESTGRAILVEVWGNGLSCRACALLGIATTSPFHRDLPRRLAIRAELIRPREITIAPS
jgi:hypothetical protein